jgi:LacI family transcriptional regulator
MTVSRGNANRGLAEPTRVLVGFSVAGMPQFEQIRRGIAAYARLRGWTLAIDPDSRGLPLAKLLATSAAGAIVAGDTPADVAAIRKARFPVVNVSGAIDCPQIARVTFDNRAIGRAAAEHLIASGYRRFAWYGLERVWYSRERRLGFEERLAEVGLPCRGLDAPSPLTRACLDVAAIPRLVDWVSRLEGPVGLAAVHDARAVLVLEACRLARLPVPDCVGVVGVNNLVELCGHADPPLSSVPRNELQVGYEAAAMLDRLLAGPRPARVPPPVFIPPAPVAVRDSTRGLAVGDSLVARALRYMLAHLGDRFGVEQLVRELRVSRRSLERAFQAAVGRSPHAELVRLRLERAAGLLRDDDRATLDMAARAAGLRDGRHLRAVLAVQPADQAPSAALLATRDRLARWAVESPSQINP